MPNRSNYSEIINRLINDREAELMPLELNRMLEEELAKPEAEIDVQLVDELLKLLEEAEPSEVEKRRMWQGISDRLGREAPERRTRFSWRRVAVVAIAAILLFTLTLGAAQALRWTFLLKLLEPLAQTFGIVTTDQLTESDSIGDGVTVDDDDFEQITYESLETMPKVLNGHVVVPGWVPERYTFEQGVAFNNGAFEKYNVQYRYNDRKLDLGCSARVPKNDVHLSTCPPCEDVYNFSSVTNCAVTSWRSCVNNPSSAERMRVSSRTVIIKSVSSMLAITWVLLFWKRAAH